jgi:hypothetical protein
MRDYGLPITAGSVGAMISALRTALDPPWSSLLRAEVLRQAGGIDLRDHAQTATLRYEAYPIYGQPSGTYALVLPNEDREIIDLGNSLVRAVLKRAGLVEMLLR